MKLLQKGDTPYQYLFNAVNKISISLLYISLSQLLPYIVILAIGFVSGVIIGIIGGDMVLAGLPVTIQFIISGIRIFAGIIGSIASTPEKDKLMECSLQKSMQKKL